MLNEKSPLEWPGENTTCSHTQSEKVSPQQKMCGQILLFAVLGAFLTFTSYVFCISMLSNTSLNKMMIQEFKLPDNKSCLTENFCVFTEYRLSKEEVSHVLASKDKCFVAELDADRGLLFSQISEAYKKKDDCKKAEFISTE